jgi:methyltransferase-like protein
LQRLAPNAIYLEQYVDFIRNRAFRQTLLCHADREPIYRLRPDALANVYIAAAVHPKNANINLQSDEPEQFQGERGVGVTVREPIVKAALAILGEEWPRRSSFHVLRARARARFEPRPAQDSGSLGRDAQVLGLSLLQFFTSVGSGLVELSLRPIPVATAPGDLPLVTSLNRYLAASGRPVVNLRHETVILGEFERQLIQRLDGTQNRNQLRESFRKLIRDKVLNVQKDGVTVTDDGQLGVLLDETINQQLGRFVRQSLLVEQSPPRAVQEKSSATVDESAKANVQ